MDQSLCRRPRNHAAAAEILFRLRQRLAGELRDYPYPIAGCDEAFKLLALQREWVRVGLAGLDGCDGVTPSDASAAIRDLLATPIVLDAAETVTLAAASGSLR